MSRLELKRQNVKRDRIPVGTFQFSTRLDGMNGWPSLYLPSNALPVSPLPEPYRSITGLRCWRFRRTRLGRRQPWWRRLRRGRFGGGRHRPCDGRFWRCELADNIGGLTRNRRPFCAIGRTHDHRHAKANYTHQRGTKQQSTGCTREHHGTPLKIDFQLR